jgi:hypothetical protein
VAEPIVVLVVVVGVCVEVPAVETVVGEDDPEAVVECCDPPQPARPPATTRAAR